MNAEHSVQSIIGATHRRQGLSGGRDGTDFLLVGPQFGGTDEIDATKDASRFGSDYPLITPDRWLADFEEAGFKDAVKPLILKRNAMRLLKLDEPASA